jgi:PKD repeat protein
MNCAEWWMEVFADDISTTSINVEHIGVLTSMELQDYTYHSKPVFTANIQVAGGDAVIYHATAKDGRTASTVPITFTYTASGQVLDCPVAALTSAVIALPGMTTLPTDPDGDGLYEDLNGNGRTDYADVVLFFKQMDWIGTNEPAGIVDFNGNGRIDFADVIRLFHEI